jgi:hypothetical protein
MWDDGWMRGMSGWWMDDWQIAKSVWPVSGRLSMITPNRFLLSFSDTFYFYHSEITQTPSEAYCTFVLVNCTCSSK